jgi:hypothetical protein
MSTLPPELQSRSGLDYSALLAAIQSRRRAPQVPVEHWSNRHGIATIAPQMGGGPAMTRNNVLYLVVGALAVAVAVLGYQLYQDRKKPEGVNINLGPGGISIEKK